MHRNWHKLPVIYSTDLKTHSEEKPGLAHLSVCYYQLSPFTLSLLPLQICCLSAATQNAFTTVLAGCGFTFTSLGRTTQNKTGPKCDSRCHIFDVKSLFVKHGENIIIIYHMISSYIIIYYHGENHVNPHGKTEFWTLPNIILVPPLVACRSGMVPMVPKNMTRAKWES